VTIDLRSMDFSMRRDSALSRSVISLPYFYRHYWSSS
jgi:hypothetical protein